MNIAHIVPYSVQFPVQTHNGRYDWVLQLAYLQIRRGHNVTIYCNPNSVIDGIQTAGIPTASNDAQENNRATFRLALETSHDIYHSHFDNLHYEMAHETARPIVFTQHWWPHPDTIRFAQKNPGNVWAVPPTQYMYTFDLQEHIQTRGRIYHGVDLDFYTPSNVNKNGRLLFVGRISPEKNVGVAIEAAKKTGLGLDIIGKIADKNRAYWDTLAHQIDGDQICYLGPKTHAELIDYYTAATAVLFPSDVNEPFGLVAIEAQACGTPIIMKRGGSRAELVREGVTGFLCTTSDEFATAALHSGKLSPDDCRKFSQHFSMQTMAIKYDELYTQLVAA